MSRRSVLRAGVGAMLAPIVKLRDEIPREAILRQFADVDCFHRFKLDEPFGIGSLTYATDRFAVARCELERRTESGLMALPPIEDRWPRWWQPAWSWVPIDEAETSCPDVREWAGCPECGNRFVSYGATFPDFSDTELMSRLGELSYSVDDNQIRDQSCQTCRGRSTETPNVSEILGVRHSTFFLKRIRNIPDVLISRTAYNSQMILFKGSGFQGVSIGVHYIDQTD